MTQNGLETVPIASGGPGNRFLYQFNVFFILKKGTFLSYYLLPLFPVFCLLVFQSFSILVLQSFSLLVFQSFSLLVFQSFSPLVFQSFSLLVFQSFSPLVFQSFSFLVFQSDLSTYPLIHLSIIRLSTYRLIQLYLHISYHISMENHISIDHISIDHII